MLKFIKHLRIKSKLKKRYRLQGERRGVKKEKAKRRRWAYKKSIFRDPQLRRIRRKQIDKIGNLNKLIEINKEKTRYLEGFIYEAEINDPKIKATLKWVQNKFGGINHSNKQIIDLGRRLENMQLDMERKEDKVRR